MQPIKMEEKLQPARLALMNMFKVLEKDIIQMKSRKQNKVHARMFYNYYLWKVFKVPHNDIKKYIDGMHHATSIYLKNKLEFEIDKYNSVAKEWETFLYFAKYQEIKELNKEKVKHLIEEYKKKKEKIKNCESNHIDMDDWFKYSGKTEEDSKEYKNLMHKTKADCIPKKSRKEYFREYWRKRSLKENTKKIK
jgi:hypothetical protein